MDDEMARAISAMVQPLHESQTRLLIAATIFAPFFYGEAHNVRQHMTASGAAVIPSTSWLSDRARVVQEMKHALVMADDLIEASKQK